MGSRYAVKTAVLTFGSTNFDMESGYAMKPETKEAVEVTALSDTIKQFIEGALKEMDEFTLPIYMKGANDITVDDSPAALSIAVVLENGIDADVEVSVAWNRAIVTKVAPSQIQASSDRKALYDVTFRPDGSVAAAATSTPAAETPATNGEGGTGGTSGTGGTGGTGN